MAVRPARMSPEARAWLLAEITYLAGHSPSAAARVLESFKVARQTLSDYPKIGTVGLIPGTRRLVVGQYVLTTRQRGGTIGSVAIRNARPGDSDAPAEAKS